MRINELINDDEFKREKERLTKDKKINIELPHWAQALKICKESLLSLYSSLEPTEMLDDKGKSEPDDSLCSILRSGRDSNPQPPA